MNYDQISPKLSICIATYNRCNFICETLDSVLTQIDENIEIIIVDGGSKDKTREKVTPYLKKHDNIFYYQEETNSGVDCDYDKSIKYARGKYCWLLPDDDLVIPGSIARILQIINENYDLIVLNSELWNADFSINLNSKMHTLPCDRIYNIDDGDKIFEELSTCLSYIGSTLIKKSVWLSRERASYYGSLFIHVGMIFQRPSLKNVIAVSEPFIKIRYGNGMWTPRSFEIWYFKWPRLIWSFPEFDDTSKIKIISEEPWRNMLLLFKSRAKGDYSHSEFISFLSPIKFNKKFLAFLISKFPAKIANLFWIFYYSIFRKNAKYALYDLLYSRHASLLGKSFAKLMGIRL